MILRRFVFCLLILIFSSHAAQDLHFVNDIKRYYCAADWICKSFERMSAKEFAQSWTQLASLMANGQYRWFYMCDMPAQYQHKRDQRYSTIMRYNAESLDSYWVAECVKYHEFLKNYSVDAERSVLVARDEKKIALDGEQLVDKRFVQARTYLTSVAPESVFLFYSFFFEQLANVMVNTMNYLYECSHENHDHILALFRQWELLTTIYYLCVHTTDSSSEQAHKLAYHYRRIESMVSMIAFELLKRDFA